MTAAAPGDLGSWWPRRSWWVIAACVLAAGYFGNWRVSAAVLLLLLVQVTRPFDFLVSVLLVVGGATFLDYQAGTLTSQLAILSAAILFMLFCYARAAPERMFSLCRSDLTRPLLAFVILSAANAIRGLLAGHPTKHLLLELLPVLAICSAFLIANGFDPARHARIVIAPLTGIAYGSAAVGYHGFSIFRTHVSGVYFQPVPGLVALLLFNLALRARAPRAALGWIALSLPLFLHQFLSYRRGLWLGTLMGLVSSVLIFAWGPRMPRWKRAAALVGTLIAAGIAGAGTLALLYGQADILQQAGGRFTSIGSTEYRIESFANVARLMEYATVAEHIQRALVFGHGLGYTFVVLDPLGGDPSPQWWVHQNYLFVWLKQGVIGLVVFVWMLLAAFWLGVRHSRRREDPFESAWLGASAAGTGFMAVFALADFPFGSAETVFLLGLLWGGAMAMTHRGFLRLRWHPSSQGVEPGIRTVAIEAR